LIFTFVYLFTILYHFSIQGVTITASSGDDGAVNDEKKCQDNSGSTAGYAKWAVS